MLLFLTLCPQKAHHALAYLKAFVCAPLIGWNHCSYSFLKLVLSHLVYLRNTTARRPWDLADAQCLFEIFLSF